MKQEFWSGLTIFGVGGLLAAGYAAAHHSFAAAYDENAPLNVQGIVTRVELTNPHLTGSCFLQIQTSTTSCFQ